MEIDDAESLVRKGFFRRASAMYYYASRMPGINEKLARFYKARARSLEARARELREARLERDQYVYDVDQSQFGGVYVGFGIRKGHRGDY